MIFNASVLIVSFAIMEFVAWFTHKYIMHGIGWFFHKDHHHKNHQSSFERNDFFFLLFAIPGILCMYFGSQNNFSISFWVGCGITLYGGAYFLVHDIFIHQRLNLFRDSNSVYLRAIRKAHKVHHKHLNQHKGECFGMLVVPFKYFLEARKSLRD